MKQGNEILAELQRLSNAVEEQNKILREVRRWMRLESEKLYTGIAHNEDEDRVKGLEIEEQNKLLKEIRNWIKYKVKQ